MFYDKVINQYPWWIGGRYDRQTDKHTQLNNKDSKKDLCYFDTLKNDKQLTPINAV